MYFLIRTAVPRIAIIVYQIFIITRCMVQLSIAALLNHFTGFNSCMLHLFLSMPQLIYNDFCQHVNVMLLTI